MTGGPIKINPPNSHPSNPIHKKVTEAQGLVKKKKKKKKKKKNTNNHTNTSHRCSSNTNTNTDANHRYINNNNRLCDTHHVNKALVGFGALVFVGFVIWARK